MRGGGCRLHYESSREAALLCPRTCYCYYYYFYYYYYYDYDYYYNYF